MSPGAGWKRRIKAGLILPLCMVALICCCTGPDGKPLNLSNPTGAGSGNDGRSGPTERPEPAPPALRDVWPPKAIWVARTAYRCPADIVKVMDDCCRAGFNTVLFQVRGEGTVYYASRLEPWAYEYADSPPSFDPLALACREAHRRGMALHAWVNTMPGWRGTHPPSDPRQLYNAHPDWFWYDQKGRRQPLDGFYVSLNPCRPEVRQYLAGVMREIVTGYPVDGLHLDYIRFPMDQVRRGTDYPHDKRTLWIFRRDTGKRPEEDPAVWNRWRTEQVSQLVRDIRALQKKTRPGMLLTAACGADLGEYKRHYFQDGASWLRAGLVDAVFVMNYNTSTSSFRERHDAWRRAAGARTVVPGIGEYLHNKDSTTIEQVKLARQWGKGLAIFSYQSLFAGGKPGRIGAIRWLIADR